MAKKQEITPVLRRITALELDNWLKKEKRNDPLLLEWVVTRADIERLTGFNKFKVAKICLQHQYKFPRMIGYLGRSEIYPMKPVVDWIHHNKKNKEENATVDYKNPMVGLDNQLAKAFLKNRLEELPKFSGYGKVLQTVHLEEENFYTTPHSGLNHKNHSENYGILRLEQYCY